MVVDDSLFPKKEKYPLQNEILKISHATKNVAYWMNSPFFSSEYYGAYPITENEVMWENGDQQILSR